jgi:hypothetical protein
MMKKHLILAKTRTFIGFSAVLAIVITVCAGRAFAQAPAGPLPSAAPADQPPPAAKPRTPAQIGGKPNLSGAWTLNKDDSDDPREKMQQAGNSGGQRRGGWSAGGGMGGGGWGGMGGGRRGGGAGGGRGQGSSSDGERDGMMNDLSHITIEQTATSAKVADESGRVLAVYSSEDSSRANSPSSSSNSESAPPMAQWKDAQLVVVTPGRREGSTTRTFELSPDGKQLYVTTKIQNPRFKNPVTIRFVYDPTPSGG